MALAGRGLRIPAAVAVAAVLALPAPALAGFRTVHDVQVSSSYSVLEVQEAPGGGYAVAGGRPMFLLLADASGDRTAFHRYDADAAAALDATADGGWVLAGEKLNYDDYAVVKVDAGGAVQWSRVYSQFAGDQGLYSIRQTAAGGYVASGIFTLGLDGAGDVAWSRIHVGGGGNVNCVRLTADGGSVATGEGSYGNPAMDYNFVVTRLDGAGNVVWNRAHGGDLYDWAAAVDETETGAFLVAGWTTSFGAGGRDGFVAQLDPAGVLEWARTYGTTGDDALQSIEALPGGGFVAAGQIDGAFALLRADAAGDVAWATTHPAAPGARTSTAYSVRRVSGGGHVAAGRDESGRLLLVGTDATGQTGCLAEAPAVLVGDAPFLAAANGTNGAGTWMAMSATITATPGTPPVTPCVAPVNRDPACDAGPDVLAGCGPVRLAGTASDPDGDVVRVAWTSTCGATFMPAADVLAPEVDLGSTCAVACVLTLEVDDMRGGTCADDVRVIVDDLDPPVVTCPADLLLECGDAVPPPDVASVAASDGCGGVTITHVGDAAAGTCPASIDRTYRATDACGNAVTCTQSIAFEDASAPEMLCADLLDNDGDTLVDCADPDCALDPVDDCDGDGAANGTDCAPRDATASALLGEVTGLMVAQEAPAGAALLRWDDVTGSPGAGTTHDVVGGRISGPWLDRDLDGATCVGSAVAALALDDRRSVPGPPAGFPREGFWYLVRAANACGAGTIGAGSLGERVIDPFPCP